MTEDMKGDPVFLDVADIVNAILQIGWLFEGLPIQLIVGIPFTNTLIKGLTAISLTAWWRKTAFSAAMILILFGGLCPLWGLRIFLMCSGIQIRI